MSLTFRCLCALILATSVFLLAGGETSAQTNDLGQYSSPYSTYTNAMNGFPPSAYATTASGNLPTYLTSINYPLIYGAYTYGHAPGKFVFGAQSAPGTTAPTIYSVSAPETNGFSSMRTVADTAATPLRSTATVNVLLPVGAELSFQGIEMGQTGDYRRFVTPPLVPGNSYTYDIRATWSERGREMTSDRRVAIQAGDQLTVDMLIPARTREVTATLRAKPSK